MARVVLLVDDDPLVRAVNSVASARERAPSRPPGTCRVAFCPREKISRMIGLIGLIAIIGLKFLTIGQRAHCKPPMAA